MPDMSRYTCRHSGGGETMTRGLSDPSEAIEIPRRAKA